MTSPLLALFARSVREDTRLKMTYVARVALILVILLLLLSVSQSTGWGNAPGLRFFGTVLYINFAFIILAGFSHFASAITEEKEEMTLGLLRMTNLNALSILLGKSTSRMVNALLLLAVQFPFTLLAISLGGVAVRQVLAAYCTLAAFIILLANLALFASVICRRSTGAAVFTGVTLFVCFAVVPFLRWIASLPTAFGIITEPSIFVRGLNHLADAVSLGSPFRRLGEILGTGFAGSPFGVQVWSDLGLGLACFLLAWSVFEIFCNEQHEAAQPRSLLARRTSRLRRLGAGRVWRRALAWKDFYFLTGGKGWMLVKLVFYAVPSALYLLLNRRFANQQIDWENLGAFMFWIAFLIACVELAFICASFLRQERQWKTLSSLAMLPAGLRRIARQKFLGCLPSLFPAFLYMGIGAILIINNSRSSVTGGWSSGASIFLFFAVAQFVLFLHVIALLSLHLRRGALPAAIAIHFVGNILVGLMMVATREEATLFLLAAVFTVIAGVLHGAIGGRLEKLAEED